MFQGIDVGELVEERCWSPTRGYPCPIRDRTAFRTADGRDGQGTGRAFRSAEAVDGTTGGRATGQAEGRRTDQGVDGRLWLAEPGGQLSHLVTTKDRK